MSTFSTGSALTKLFKNRVSAHADLTAARQRAFEATNERDQLQVELAKIDIEIQNLIRQLPQ
jgi:hypothetical protein